MGITVNANMMSIVSNLSNLASLIVKTPEITIKLRLTGKLNLYVIDLLAST